MPSSSSKKKEDSTLKIEGVGSLKIKNDTDDTGNLQEIKTTWKRWIVVCLPFLIGFFCSSIPFNSVAFQISIIYEIAPEKLIAMSLVFYGVSSILPYLASLSLIDQYKCVATILVPSIVFFVSNCFFVASLYFEKPNLTFFYRAALSSCPLSPYNLRR